MPILRTAPDSPARNTGLVLGAPFLGTAPDIGAYEEGDLMATFPDYPIISTFDGLTENPVSDGGKWSANPVLAGTFPMQASGGIALWVGTLALSYIATPMDDRNHRAFVDLFTRPPDGTWGGVLVRISDPNTASMCCYALLAIAIPGGGNDVFQVHRFDNAVNTALGANIPAAADFSNGDGIGLEAVGETLNVWHRVNGVWSLVGQRTTGASYDGRLIGMGASDFAFLNDFGGGSEPRFTVRQGAGPYMTVRRG